ncbi:hypothetical protein GE09DRAFT_1131775 [Coniochaeta sp. 2T2.1]|nr:hypothetical protein GE09DRAFT_1131775 [Coniochaeta sp. 2T2.1]
MSYGTRGRKVAEEDDPTVIPSTAPLGFLGRLPFKIGGTLRYKPSAANLKEHPGQHREEGQERQPLLGTREDEEPVEEGEREGYGHKRQRSNTSGSGATSDSYRSRNDLFPSDGEGEEDAVPLDDEFAVALDRVDDKGSNRTRSSKGKRVEGRSNSGLSLNLARTVSRTTIGSAVSRESPGRRDSGMRQVDGPEEQTLDDLHREEELVRLEEEEEVERKRRRAAQLAAQRGLSRDDLVAAGKEETVKTEPLVAEPDDTPGEHKEEEAGYGTETANKTETEPETSLPLPPAAILDQPVSEVKKPPAADFVPARLPHFQ